MKFEGKCCNCDSLLIEGSISPGNVPHGMNDILLLRGKCLQRFRAQKNKNKQKENCLVIQVAIESGNPKIYYFKFGKTHMVDCIKQIPQEDALADMVKRLYPNFIQKHLSKFF